MLYKKAINTSQYLSAEFDTRFALRTNEYYPHLSLYMIQLKIAELKQAKILLQAIAVATPELSLQTDRYSQVEGYIDANYVHTKAAADLQMSVIEAINPVRDGMREKDKTRMLNATGKVRENLEQYGYRDVGELFRPHLTLSRFVDSHPIDTSKLPAPSEFDGQFVKLGLFERGDNGTCVRKIAEFELGR